MTSYAQFSLVVFATPGKAPHELELLRDEAALLDRVWHGLRDFGVAAAWVELDAEDPVRPISRRHLSVAR